MSGRDLKFLCLGVLVMSLVACSSDNSKERRWYPNGKPRNEDWHSPVTTLMKYDANHDGTLTRAELEAGLRVEFDAHDKNHSGCLDEEEVRAINAERTTSDESAASPLIDWKSKGCVDFDEYAATARSLFEQLDRNGDGKLTPDEVRPRGARQRKQAPPDSSGGGY